MPGCSPDKNSSIDFGNKPAAENDAGSTITQPVIRNFDRLESPGGKPNSPTQTSHTVSNAETSIRAVAGFTSVCKTKRFDSYRTISPATPNPVPRHPLNTPTNK